MFTGENNVNQILCLISAMTDQFWRMQSPVAFSSILLDQEMYKQLTEDRAKQGLRLEGVPVQVRK